MSDFLPPLPMDAPERPDMRPAPPGSDGRPDPADGWKPWTGLGALAGALFVVLLASVVIGVFAAAFGADVEDPPAGVNISLTAVQGTIFVLAALFFAQLAAVPRATDFGLRAPRKWWLAVLLVPAAWLGFVALSAIWVAIIGESPDEDLPDELGAGDSDVALIAVMVLVCVLAPVGEEFLFRGYIFRALRNWRGMWPAALLSGMLFGAIHLLSADVIALLPLALLGIGMALVYHYTDSLYTAMALHALNNAIAFSISQDWDWQIPLVMAGGIPATLLLGYGVQRGIDAGHRRLVRERV